MRASSPWLVVFYGCRCNETSTAPSSYWDFLIFFISGSSSPFEVIPELLVLINESVSTQDFADHDSYIDASRCVIPKLVTVLLLTKSSAHPTKAVVVN
jgi:hypothetical protein